MTKLKDLSGQKFGRLTVIKLNPRLIKGRASWLCRCDCGTIKSIKSQRLINGTTRSCGCLKVKDLVGRRFGRLTVICFDRVDANQQARWLCRCDCGTEKSIIGANLSFGTSKSCGCLQKEILSDLRIKEITWVVSPNGCWECDSHHTYHGYPFALRNNKYEIIARIMYKQIHPEELDENGEIPIGLEYCHNCDNPNCINPAHGRLDTHSNNMRDMVERNRQAKGENVGGVKLNAHQAQFIYENNQIPQNGLAELFDVSTAAIHDIKTGINWKHVTHVTDPNHDPHPIIMSGETVFNDGDDPEVFSCEWSSDDYLKELGYVKDE